MHRGKGLQCLRLLRAADGATLDSTRKTAVALLQLCGHGRDSNLETQAVKQGLCKRSRGNACQRPKRATHQKNVMAFDSVPGQALQCRRKKGEALPAKL